MQKLAGLWLLPLTLVATVLLAVIVIAQTLVSAPTMIELLGAFTAAFIWPDAPAGNVVPVPFNTQAVNRLQAALDKLDGAKATAVIRTRALLDAAQSDWSASLAALDTGASGAAPNPVLFLTRAAILEEAARKDRDADSRIAWSDQRDLAWRAAIGDPGRLVSVANSLAAQSEVSAAVQWYERATGAFPEYREVWYYLADLYLGRGEPARAIETLRQGLGARRTTGQIGKSNLYYKIGRVLNYTMALNDPDAVDRAYQTALKLADFGTKASDESDLHFQLGHRAFGEQQWEDACVEYTRAIVSDAKAYNPRLMLAAALLHRGMIDEAVDRLEEAIQILPHEKAAYWWLADLYRYTNQAAEAQSVIERILQLDPTDPIAEQAHNDLRSLPTHMLGL